MGRLSSIPALSSPRFARLKQQSDADAPSAGDGELRLRIMQTPFAQRPFLLADCLRGHVSHVLRIPETELDLDAPLTSGWIPSWDWSCATGWSLRLARA